MTQYRVTAPYVTLKVADSNGNEVVQGFYEGGLVTDPVAGPSLDKHLRQGLIEAANDPAPGVPDDEPQPPARNASKAEWVHYAVSQGADPAVAEASSKDDLIATYA